MGVVEGSVLVILPQIEQYFDSPSGVRVEMIMFRAREADMIAGWIKTMQQI
jgi:hypothetical protein